VKPEQFRDRVFELARDEDNTYKVAARALDEITDPADWEVIARLTAPPYISNMLKRVMPPEHLSVPGGRGQPVPTFSDANGNQRASSRQVSFVDWWTRRLAVKILTPGGHKTLGACTATDLDWIAQQRRAKAEENVAAAVRYEKLAAAIRESGRRTVAEIDAATGRAILGD